MTDYADIHPPNVVLVASNQGSPTEGAHTLADGHHHAHCSPLSTAPNSPNHYVTDDDDDEEDDDEDEIRPEEIQELLDTPASPSFLKIPTFREPPHRDAPFDETQQQQQPNTTNTTPSLKPKPKFVSPFKEEIDAYVEDEDELDGDSEDSEDSGCSGDDELSDEKKEDDNTSPPPPNYASYLINNNNKGRVKRLSAAFEAQQVIAPQKSDLSESDSVPMDERCCWPSAAAYSKQQVGGSGNYDWDSHRANREGASLKEQKGGDFSSNFCRTNETKNQRSASVSPIHQDDSSSSDPESDYGPMPVHDDIEDEAGQTSQKVEGQEGGYQESPMKKALQTAEREVQEMERRVQAMIQQRRQTSQTRFVEDDPSDCEEYAVHEPPSLSSPQPVQVNSSLESSSYYYDGSVMGSSQSRSNGDVNNTTLNTTTSSSAVRQHANNTNDNSSEDPVSRDLSRDYYSKRTTDDSPEHQEKSNHNKYRDHRGSSNNFAANFSTSPPTFTTDFDTAFDKAFDKAFDNAIDNTTKAFAQVTDGLASYVLGPPNGSASEADNALSSHPDSDTTPQLGNLSPVNSTQKSKAIRQDFAERADKMYRPSDKIARARSLVSGKRAVSSSSSSSKPQQTTSGLSPNSISNAERARQVILQRQRSDTKSPKGDQNEEDGLNLPVPPTLRRIAAMIEGVTTEEDASKAEPAFSSKNAEEWPSSVSQMMEEYQTAITESLRNLSMEEVACIAGSPSTKRYSYGKGTMAAPGIPIMETQKSYDYEDFVAGMAMAGCLELPQLNHPAQDDDAKEYDTCRAGILHYGQDGGDYQGDNGNDSEHDERAVFARQLSERLLDLEPVNASTDTGSILDNVSPEKVTDRRNFLRNQQQARTVSEDQDISFRTNESSLDMSPPKRSLFAGARVSEGDFAVSGVPKNAYLPSSDQPSAASDLPASFSNSRKESPDRDPSSEASSKPVGANREPSAGIPTVTKPTMVESIDTEVGIAKGDVILSLLCDNSFQATKEKPDSWTWRVREAIWRCRDMRRNFFGAGGSDEQPTLPERGIRRAQSCPVDVDDVRVVGGIRNVASIQEKALTHLQRDEFEEALELYEDIIFNYYSFFEQVLEKRDEFSSQDVSAELSNFKPYIGASLHNLGVIHLVKGDYEDAFSFFKRAVENRRSCLGEDHPDTISSLVRLSCCRFAMDNFADAHANLELALSLAGSKARTSKDYCQLGEILNNLGCLSYMCGQPTKAMQLFREAMDVQLAVQNSTLYGGSKYASHSITLNISVVRGNIGFLALVLKDVSSGIVALESALRDQRLLLSGAHVTLVSTMDHLAVANLLEGRTQKALKMLRRIYDLQKFAHGPLDPRCFATRQKIITIRSQQTGASKKRQGNNDPETGNNDEYSHVAPQAPGEVEMNNGHQDETKDAAGDDLVPPRKGTGTGGQSGPKGSLLTKAIKSFRRKKTC